MKRSFLGTFVTSASLVAAAVLATACSDGANDQLLGSGAPGNMATDPTSLAGGPGNTQHHFQESIGGDNGITDPQTRLAEDNVAGSPEAVARLHGSQKVGYQSLGRLLADLGVSLQAQDPASAGSLYRAGGSALGQPIYANRVPEQIVPSTSSLAKQFDIFTAAAPEIMANIGTSKRCPGVVLIDAVSKQFTADGVTCLLGKTARPEHVALANQILTESSTPQIGQSIAIATLLSAAHTSE